MRDLVDNIIACQTALTNDSNGVVRLFRMLRKVIPIKTSSEREIRASEQTLNKRIEQHNENVENNQEYAEAFELYKRMIHKESNSLQLQIQNCADWSIKNSRFLPEISTAELTSTRNQIINGFRNLPNIETIDLLAMASLYPNADDRNVKLLMSAQKRIQQQKETNRVSIEVAIKGKEEAEKAMTPMAYRLYGEYEHQELTTYDEVCNTPGGRLNYHMNEGKVLVRILDILYGVENKDLQNIYIRGNGIDELEYSQEEKDRMNNMYLKAEKYIDNYSMGHSQRIKALKDEIGC